MSASKIPKFLLLNLVYLAYKVTNALMLRYWRFRHFRSGCLIHRDIWNNKKSLCFDFTHHTSHLGDRIFFFPLFYALLENKVPFRVKDPAGHTQLLFSSIYNRQLGDLQAGAETIIVAPHSSLLGMSRHQRSLIIVDFYHQTNLGIADSILESFQKMIGFSSVTNQKIAPSTTKQTIDLLDTKDRFILFNNYLGSGNYRKFFVDESKLEKKCIESKEYGVKIVHVGATSDLEDDSKVYDFVDIDLRGKLSIPQLIQLFFDVKTIAVVSYDNFYMHLAGIFGKEAHVLFRGRFLQKNIDHHLRTVNPALFKDKTKLHYL